MPDSTTCTHQTYCLMRDETDMRFISHLTRNTFAIILAGGRGSRLRQLTDFRSKPAVPFAGKFRILDFTLSNCVNSGIRKIGVATQYKAHSLIRHIQRGWSFLDGRFDEFIQLLPAQQQIDDTQWYQGTADAVYQNKHFLKRYNPEHILIVAGDHIYKMDYGRMLAIHAQHRADMTVACIDVPLGEAGEFGVMGVDEDDRVIDFLEKPQNPPSIPGQPDRALASMGIYIFNAKFLFEQLERDALTKGSSRDFGRDIIPHIVPRYRVFAHRFADSCVGSEHHRPYWRDVGTIDAYWEANMEMTKVTPELNLYDKDWPIWTYQEQLPPAKFVFDDDGRRGMAIDSLISGGCIISGAAVKRSLLFSSVTVHSWTSIEDSVILPGVDIGRRALLKRCVIDKNCRIPDGMIVGVDPEADRKRFHVSPKGITLVTAEMLGQGAAENR
ncbi:MAG: glucose-1-phosphate adenylyltransferase [Candidatus Dechloromonas phosphoritropha]|nr:glucose-1-phosphate adenylyltransferase [Candidatus Dechloromonas phosphoritropha]MBP8788042.1 glucose-1-phosphate adenylyltransferase [Azonexus sp.]MBP9228415.1 glucose-1-phosphate adenylyltransferase [Azonexus sp.]